MHRIPSANDVLGGDRFPWQAGYRSAAGGGATAIWSRSALPAGTTCMASSCGGLCGFSVACRDGVWSWLEDCTCHGHVCASPDTPIATPYGERPIADLRIGDVVYSVDHDSIRGVPIAAIRRQRVEDHRVVRMSTSDGRTLEISAPHPTADGRVFGDLQAGDSLDGRAIESVEVITYSHDFTYDILPGSDTGTYFAAGMQIGSTLSGDAARSRPRAGRVRTCSAGSHASPSSE